MRDPRLSLLYIVAYLVGTGVFLLFVPSFSLALLGSTGSYGEVMPRMAGALALVLGVVILQIFRLRLDALIPTLIWARVFLCAAWIGLYLLSRDRFFLVVLAVVFFGLCWTTFAYRASQGARA